MKKAIGAIICAIIIASMLIMGCNTTNTPTEAPTAVPTEAPTPTPEPTEAPTPTPEPTEEPTPSPTPEPDVPEGMQIMNNDNIYIILPSGFFNTSSLTPGVAACFASTDTTVIFTKETFETLGTQVDDAESMTEEDYANLVITLSQLDSTVKTEGERCIFEYNNTANDIEYHYVAIVIKADDAFYMAQFASPSADYSEEVYATYMQWADTISIG